DSGRALEHAGDVVTLDRFDFGLADDGDRLAGILDLGACACRGDGDRGFIGPGAAKTISPVSSCASAREQTIELQRNRYIRTKPPTSCEHDARGGKTLREPSDACPGTPRPARERRDPDRSPGSPDRRLAPPSR